MDGGVGQRITLAFGARAQYDRAHRSRQADADGGYVRAHELHSVIDRQPAVIEPPGDWM